MSLLFSVSLDLVVDFDFVKDYIKCHISAVYGIRYVGGLSMDIKDIGSIRFEALRTDEAKELGINVLFQEEDGTYDWIYCLSMAKNL